MACRNIIFDMGNVLMYFDPQRFIQRLDVTHEDAQCLMREIFRSLEWCHLDRGSLIEQEAAERICARVPEHLRPQVWQLVCRWDEPILPMEGMEALLVELKSAGCGLYLLSNATSRQHTYWPRIPGSELFDGTFISADHHLVKPQPEAYQAMLRQFGLNAQDCVFIDDSPSNVEGALYCGLPAIVFRGDVTLLRRQIVELGIQISL